MHQVKENSKVDTFLMKKDWRILNKTIYNFFNIVP